MSEKTKVKTVEDKNPRQTTYKVGQQAPATTAQGEKRPIVMNPYEGLLAPNVGDDKVGKLIERMQAHLYEGPVQERSEGQQGKDERALCNAQFIARVYGSRVYAEVADIVMSTRISRGRMGRNEDISAMQAEREQELQRFKLRLLEQQANQPERR